MGGLLNNPNLNIASYDPAAQTLLNNSINRINSDNPTNQSNEIMNNVGNNANRLSGSQNGNGPMLNAIQNQFQRQTNSNVGQLENRSQIQGQQNYSNELNQYDKATLAQNNVATQVQSDAYNAWANQDIAQSQMISSLLNMGQGIAVAGYGMSKGGPSSAGGGGGGDSSGGFSSNANGFTNTMQAF